jgi:hypothetical protein
MAGHPSDTRAGRRRRLLALAIYALVAGNLAALWVARGPYVNGWDLFGATFAVLALHRGTLADGVRTIVDATLRQEHRAVFTGGESLIYGLVPGLLNMVSPWLLWSHFLNLVLFVAISLWIVWQLRLPAHVWWACVAASPALTSLAIIGLPDLPSTAIPWGLAVGWVLSARQPWRGVVSGVVLDVLVFAAIAAIAFNGYESGKTFFVVPVVAALTVRDVRLPRRIAWLACAGAVAWLVYTNRAATTHTALAAVPREPIPFLRGVLAFLRAYVVDWYIDFPALGLAGFACLLLVRRHRLFWAALWAAAFGLVTLNAFQFDGAFLVPHRFLLLAFVSALVVSAAFADRLSRSAPMVAIAALLAVGIAYNTLVTVRFVAEERSNAPREWNADRVYPLPYNRAQLDAHVWRDRIHDAARIVELTRRGPEAHVLFYGFSVEGEDSVNPQVIVSRLLLPLGYPVFMDRIRFIDHSNHMYFPFPIDPLDRTDAILGGLRPPFYVHVREPEHSGESLLAKHLNNARVEPVDLGLLAFRSYRVDAWARPEPISLPPLPPDAHAHREPATGAFELCLVRWEQSVSDNSPLRHWKHSLAADLDMHLKAARSAAAAPRYLAVSESRTSATGIALDRSAVGYFVGRVWNPGDQPLWARLTVVADDEVAVLANGIVVLESHGRKPQRQYAERLLLPPGRSELRLVYRKYFQQPGGMHFRLVGRDGRRLPLTCAAGLP